MQTLYDMTANMNNGRDLFSFASLENKTVLVVVSASLSSFSKQLRELQSLYQKHQNDGLEIVAVPSGNYSFFTSGDQELNGNVEILKYYRDFYNVTFTVLDKANKESSALLKFLSQQDKPAFKLGYQNFTKFLFDKKGHFVKRFIPQTNLNKVEDAICVQL